MECDFVSVDVWDTLGTNLQNVTKDVTKWSIDHSGQVSKFHGRNKQQARVHHEVHSETHEETLYQLAEAYYANSEYFHSVILTKDNRKKFFKEWNVAIVEYFAP